MHEAVRLAICPPMFLLATSQSHLVVPYIDSRDVVSLLVAPMCSGLLLSSRGSTYAKQPNVSRSEKFVDTSRPCVGVLPAMLTFLNWVIRGVCLYDDTRPRVCPFLVFLVCSHHSSRYSGYVWAHLNMTAFSWTTPQSASLIWNHVHACAITYFDGCTLHKLCTSVSESTLRTFCKLTRCSATAWSRMCTHFWGHWLCLRVCSRAQSQWPCGTAIESPSGFLVAMA